MGGLRLYADAHTVVRGTVLAHRIIRDPSFLITGRAVMHRVIPPARYVVRVRDDAGDAREYDIDAHFWSEAHDGNRIRREGGIWQVIDRK